MFTNKIRNINHCLSWWSGLWTFIIKAIQYCRLGDVIHSIIPARYLVSSATKSKILNNEYLNHWVNL